MLVDFFNSKIGFYYVILSNLETIQLINEYYKDNLTQERINTNLKMFKLKSSQIASEKSELEREVNKAAYKYFSENLK